MMHLDKRINQQLDLLETDLSNASTEIQIKSTTKHINLLKIVKELYAAVSHQTYWIGTSENALKSVSSVITTISEKLNQIDLSDLRNTFEALSLLSDYCSTEKNKRESSGKNINPKISRLLNRILYVFDHTKITNGTGSEFTISYLDLSMLSDPSYVPTTTTTTMAATTTATTSNSSSSSSAPTTTTSTATALTSVTTPITTTTQTIIPDLRLDLEKNDVLTELLAQFPKLFTPTPLEIVAEQLNSIENESSLKQAEAHAAWLRKRSENRAEMLSSLQKNSSKPKKVISTYAELEEVYTRIEHIKNSYALPQRIEPFYYNNLETNETDWIDALKKALDYITIKKIRPKTRDAGSIIGKLNEELLDPQLFIWFQQEQRDHSLIQNKLQDRKAALQKYDCFLTLYNALHEVMFHPTFWNDTNSIGLKLASSSIPTLQKPFNSVDVSYYYSVTTCQNIYQAIMEFATACEKDKLARTGVDKIGHEWRASSKLTALYTLMETLMMIFPKEFNSKLDEDTIKNIKSIVVKSITTETLESDALTIKQERTQADTQKKQSKKSDGLFSLFGLTPKKNDQVNELKTPRSNATGGTLQTSGSPVFVGAGVENGDQSMHLSRITVSALVFNNSQLENTINLNGSVAYLKPSERQDEQQNQSKPNNLRYSSSSDE